MIDDKIAPEEQKNREEAPMEPMKAERTSETAQKDEPLREREEVPVELVIGEGTDEAAQKDEPLREREEVPVELVIGEDTDEAAQKDELLQQRMEALEREIQSLKKQVETAKKPQKAPVKTPPHGQPGTIEDIQYRIMCRLFGRTTADMILIADKIARKKVDTDQKRILMEKEIDAYYGKAPEKLDSAELIKRERVINYDQQMPQEVLAMLLGTLVSMLITLLVGTNVPFVWFVLVVVLLIAVMIGRIRVAIGFSTHYDELRVREYEKERIDKTLKERMEIRRQEADKQAQEKDAD